MTDSALRQAVFDQISAGFEQLDRQTQVLDLSLAAVMTRNHGHSLTPSEEPYVFMELLQYVRELTAADQRAAARAIVEAVLGCRLSPEQHELTAACLAGVAQDKADPVAATDHLIATRDAHVVAVSEARDIATHNLSSGQPKRSMGAANFRKIRWSGAALQATFARFDDGECEDARNGLAILLATLRSTEAFADFASNLIMKRQLRGAYAVASLAVSTLPDDPACRILRGMTGLHSGLAPAAESLADLPLFVDKLEPGNPLRRMADDLLARADENIAALRDAVAAGGPAAPKARELLRPVGAPEAG